MRLNFSVRNEFNGYKNINPLSTDVDFSNFDTICEPSECTEIILDDFLSYIKIVNFGKFLQQIVSRLRHKGILIIVFYDLEELSKLVFKNELNIAAYNEILFGRENDKITKSSIYNIDTINHSLTELGLNVLTMEIDGAEVIIKAQRP